MDSEIFQTLKSNAVSRLLCAAATAALCLLSVGPSHAESLLLEGGVVHSLAGEVEEASVLVVDGLIQEVGAVSEVPPETRRIDVSGLHVYPGFFDAFSRLGLVEIGSVSATVDTSELGSYNPHLTAATAVHPASEVIPVTRANGLTHALTAPAGDRAGGIAGRAALIHLDGWTIEDMALDPSAAMVIQWPAIRTRSFDFSTFSFRETPFGDAKKEAEKAQGVLRDWLDAAKHYQQAEAAGSTRLSTDLKLAHLAKVLDGGQTVIIAADAKRDIEAAAKFAEEYGLRWILAGGRDAWEVAEMLAEKQVPVILGLTQSLPNQEDDPYDRPFKNASVLAAAGVKIAFGSSAGGGFGPGGPHGSRTLPWEAAAAVAFGLPHEEALRALTLNPADMLGLGDRLGTIEPGKVANLIVVDGDPLEIGSGFRHVIIDGKEVSTDNRHRSLFERYRSR